MISSYKCQCNFTWLWKLTTMVLWDSCPYSMGQLPIQYDCFLFQLPVQCWCYYLDCTNVTKSNKAHDSDQNTHWYTRNWSEIHKKDQEKLEWPWYAVGYALNYVKWCKMSVNLQVRSLMPWFQLHTENIWINFVKFYLKNKSYMWSSPFLDTSVYVQECVISNIYHFPSVVTPHIHNPQDCMLCVGNDAGQFPVGVTVCLQPMGTEI